MKFKKDFFHQKRWSWEKNDLNKFSPKTTPLKFRDEKMKFYILELFLSGMKLFQNIFRLNFFFLEEKYIFNLSPEFRKSFKM